ncbi:XRE family transcriptional regulator [Paenibacillus anaericanus]|uniref:XRE family transcriptional regulator n=1 Tax=Paenibacillus anaericanus TaxID=170367 RepID=A0A3S1EK68_9BACL|nr:helix-turn-helix transcriptional regulator [Paenibacillus anaericanus]RUT47377.1 XRE family transcriptional regulator [Paenibacillus anaericanus]
MQNDVYVIIGTRIRYFRNINQLTQIEMANLMDVSQSTICNIENGIYPVPLHVLIQVSALLQIPLKDLLSEVI